MKSALSIPFWRNWLAQIVGLAVFYVGSALLGSFVGVAQGKVPASWPAAGLAVAALWWGGYRLAPAIGLGTFLLLQLTGAPLSTCAGISVGNTLEPVLAVYLMRCCIGGPHLFDRVHHVFSYLLLVGLVAPIPSAALGVASLCLGGVAEWEAFPSLFPLWWATDLMGALAVTPFLLAWTWRSKLLGAGVTERNDAQAMVRENEARKTAILETAFDADLTRRKQVESALRLSEERLRLLVESVTGYAIYMLDPEGRIATWNAGAERIKGYREEEIIGQFFSTFFTPEDIQRGVPAQVLKQAEQEGRTLYEGLRVRKDGARIWVKGTIAAMRDETGRLVGFSKVAHDITELRRAEEVLRLSEAHFRTLAEELPQLVWTSGPDGVCDYLSPQWSRYSGASEHKLLGSGGTLDLIHPEDRSLAAAAWRRALKTNTPLDCEFRLRSAAGEHRWFRTQAAPLRNADGQVVKWIGTNTDIDDQKRASEVLETKVKERTAQLQAALASVEELLYTIAHDLRAPNRSMQGFAELVQAECGDQLDARARDHLNRISAAAVRNDELIRDLIEYGRLSHEAAPLRPVDTRQAVQTVLHAVEHEARMRDAKFRLGQAWPRVVANEPLLEQILTHLVTNALKYVPTDRKPEIVISAEKADGHAILRVTDNGIGIPPGQIERVFKPFIRCPQPVHVPGTGMGLAFVKKAAERMNGEVGVDSTPDKGSCFWLQLRTA